MADWMSPWHRAYLNAIVEEVQKFERMDEWPDISDTAFGMLEMGHIDANELHPMAAAQIVAQGIYEGLGGFD
jgi:hypothetical protein